MEYPNIEVGGPATSWIGRAFVNRFLSNFSNEIDFISFHEYADTVYITLSSDLNQALTSCHQYNANCSRIILSEWNTYSSFIKNVSSNISQYGSNIALGYTNMLDNYPSNVSMLLYQWSEQYKYSNTQYYPEYPQLWSMVSEPQLDNAYYPPYNVTSDFAHYHSARDIVVSSSSNNGNIFVVASKNSTGQVDITVISNSTSNVSVTIGLSGALIGNFNALEDLRTGTTYSISGGSVNMGALQQYDVKHY